MDKNKIIENMKKTILEICENIGPRPPVQNISRII